MPYCFSYKASISVSIAADYRKYYHSSDCWQEFFSLPPRSDRLGTALQPLNQCVSGALSPEIEWPEREAYHSSLLSEYVKDVWAELYLHSPYIFMM
jgi:hypothetical protein